MTLEQRIAAWDTAKKKPGEFARLAKAALEGAEGQAFLSALCSVCHPLDHTFTADPRLASHNQGAREVVATLWRIASTSPQIHTS